MRKQLLLFGASVVTAIGVALLVLTLGLMLVNVATANTEANNGSECAEKNNTDCGPNDCPNDTPKCHIKSGNICGCAK